MIEKQATVIKVGPGKAWVSVERQSSCQSCSAKAGCGTGVLSEALGQKPSVIELTDNIKVQVGEQVIVGIPEEGLVKGASWLYMLPLVTMLLFSLMVETLFQLSEGVTIIAGFLGLASGFWVQSRYQQRLSHDQRFQPQLLRRLQTHPVWFARDSG